MFGFQFIITEMFKFENDKTEMFRFPNIMSQGSYINDKYYIFPNVYISKQWELQCLDFLTVCQNYIISITSSAIF